MPDAKIVDLAALDSVPIEAIPAALAALLAAQLRLTSRLLAGASAESASTASLVDAGALSRALGVHVSLIRSKSRAGAIPCTYVGRFVRYDVAAVRAALAEAKR